MNIFQRAALRLAGVTIKDLAALHPEAFTREILYSGNSDQAKDTTPETSNAYDEYAGQAWIYKATSTVARSFRSVPMYVMRGEDWIEGHPVELLLAKPNPAMSGSALWERWITDIYLAGETGIELANNKGKLELWPRQGRVVTIDSASNRYMRANGFTIKDGHGEPYKLTPPEFIWSWLYNPLSVWRGLGVYQAAALGIVTDKQAQRYAASFFKGMARPDYVVTTPQGVTQTEKDVILAQIEAMTQGKNRGIVMEQGITDIKPLSFAPKDLIWETIRNMTREEIGAVAGVPGELMGDKSATYENRAEAVKSFWNDTIRPLADWRDEHLTAYFRSIGAIKDNEAIESDFSDVEALEQSYADRLTYAVQLAGLGVTLTDANEMFDLGIPDASLALADAPAPEPPPVVAPPQGQPPPNVSPPEGQDAPQVPDTPAPQKALTRAMPWPVYGSDEHKAMLDVWEKAIAPREARMRQALKQLFAEQEKDVMRRLNAEKALTKSAADNPFDLAKWIRLFRVKLSPHIRLTLAEAGRDAMNDLNIGVSFDVSEPQVLNYMRDRENKIKGVVETTFETLKADLQQGIDAGESIDKLAARVQERMGPIADNRATMIARTEVIGASNGGKVLAWQQSGVVTGKRWLASTSHMGAGDPNPVRDSHVEAHGQEVGIGDPFQVGDGEGLAPGQIGLPEEDINCFPADTLVDISESNGITGASRRWYEGALVEIVTRTGRKLTGTPNHPVMTGRGWVPLQGLNESDRVLSRRDSCESPIVAPDVNHLPAEIGKAFDLCGVAGALERVAGGDHQFHGDGRGGEVDVVSLHGELRDGGYTEGGERVLKLHLSAPDLAEGSLLSDGVVIEPSGGLLAPSDIRISGGGERLPIIGASVGHAGEHAIATVADEDAVIAEQSLNSSARPDATLGELLDRYPGEVFLDEVISVREVEFSGHVFNLETNDGWYYANAIVSHNCRCTMLAVTDQGRGMKAMAEPEQARETPAPAQVFNITMPPINITANMPAQAAPVVNVTNEIPEQSEIPAPIVNVAAPIVNVEKQDAPVVNVSLPRATSQTQTVNRDARGSIISTTTRIDYEGG